jgi:CRP/FNR family transcriptional regulator
MGWHPIWRGTRRLVDTLDRRAEARDDRPGARSAGYWGLERLDLFRELPRADLEALCAGPRLQHYQPRQPVIVDDDAVRVLLGGAIKLARVGVTGRKLIVALLAAGDVFGRITGAAEHDSYVVEALEATEVLAMPREAFEALLQRREFAYRVVQHLEERQRELVQRVESLAFKDVRTRLIEALLALAGEHGEPCQHGMAVDVRINQQDLADLIGASRQMVNRLLGELSRKLYVRRMGKVLCILNRRRLERLVDEPLSTG